MWMRSAGESATNHNDELKEGGVAQLHGPNENHRRAEHDPMRKRRMMRGEGLRGDHHASDDGAMDDVGMLKLKREIGET